MPAHRANKSGQVFGYLMCVADTGRNHRRSALWVCETTCCGKRVEVDAGSLNDRQNRKNPLSCPDCVWVDKFWERVVKNDGGCWVWTGTTARSGYGMVKRDRRAFGAHRASWQLTYGPVPSGLFVLHHCDNRICVRPEHLYVGTLADNARDREERGRGIRQSGDTHPASKLTAEFVASARRRWAARQATQKALAAEAGVHFHTMQRALRGETWRHVS